MPVTSYPYGPGTYNTTQLQGEIVAAGGGPAALTGINGDGTIQSTSANIAIFYASALSGPDKTALDALVAAHVAHALLAPLNSVFGRTGSVVGNTGDYTAAQVTNAADKSTTNTFVNSITIGLGTITSAILHLTCTAEWANAGTTFVGILVDITDTASAAASTPLLVKGGAAGATVLFKVDKAGLCTGITFSGSGASLTSLNASNLSSGTVPVAQLPIAVETDQEAGTSNTLLVTPGVANFHPSACKGWCVFTVSGTTPTIVASYNVTSVTRMAVGKYKVTWTNVFSSAVYGAVCLARSDGSGFFTCMDNSNAQTAGTVSFQFFGAGGSLAEPTWATVLAFGDL